MCGSRRRICPKAARFDAAFTRMETDREEEAATIRAAGQRDAQITQAEAQAQAARIYAEAYGKDPEFYDFYRAMESYRQTFLGGEGSSAHGAVRRQRIFPPVPGQALGHSTRGRWHPANAAARSIGVQGPERSIRGASGKAAIGAARWQ